MNENSAISKRQVLAEVVAQIMSRAMRLRTKKYAVSPMNWPLLGHHLLLAGHDQPEDR